MLVLALALVTAVAGTAAAGDLSSAKKNSHTDAKADKKLFNKLLAKKAPKLSVKRATSAGNAGKLGGVPASGYQQRVLKSGEVLVGAWEVSGTGDKGDSSSPYASGVINFNPPLARDLCTDAACTTHTQFQATGTTSPACPGLGQATSGVLCLYETSNLESLMTYGGPPGDPESGGTAVRKYGTVLYFSTPTTAGAVGYVRGQWVLKAP